MRPFFPPLTSVLPVQNKMLPCKGRQRGVALWHLEVGIKFRLKIKPQEEQFKK